MFSDCPYFDSIDELLRFLKSEYGQKNALFRGENRLFSTTTPGTLRLMERVGSYKDFGFEEVTFFLDAAEGYLEQIEEDYESESIREEAALFLQHYGLPTDLIDFTESIDVAISFACELAEANKTGYLAVLDLSEIDSTFDVFPYKNFERNVGHPLRRAVRQKAWAYRHHAGLPKDLKASDPRLRHTIKWHSFRKAYTDGRVLPGTEELYDTFDDSWAKHMRDWLASCFANAWQASGSKARKSVIEKELKRILKGIE
jgi:hypothetical protein